jgi:hypothetical protein
MVEKTWFVEQTWREGGNKCRKWRAANSMEQARKWMRKWIKDHVRTGPRGWGQSCEFMVTSRATPTSPAFVACRVKLRLSGSYWL